MPKAAIFFSLLLFSPMITNSHAFISGDVNSIANIEDKLIFDSEIIQVNPDFFVENNFKRYLIFGNNLEENAFLKSNSIYGIQSDNGFFSVSIMSETLASDLVSQGYYVIEDFKLDFHSSDEIIKDVSRIGDITGSNLAKTKYNSTGNGTIIAIVDTGVDFSNPDMQHSLARDKINHPIMLDPDGQGIVLTNATFFAYVDKNEIIRNYSKPIPPNMTSSAYVTRDGVFLDVSQGGKGSDIPIYNSFFPQVGSSVIFNGTLTNDMKIGDDNRNYIKSKSGVYHLGVIYQGGLSGPLARIQVVPVLVVDSFTAGVYDTIIPDLSTSWEDYTRFDLESGKKANYDFDFTDEKPIVLGSGKEFLVYDSNGDGKNDYSAGTLGAQVLDVYGAIRKNSTDIHDALNAINGTLLPALDSDGEFFGIMTDFMGHGTSSAASIVSRGQETYDIYNNSKKYSITGVAPDAKIVPVKALWFGDTV
ncbi:MAG: S8 family serine peptidase, partial [Nitrosopumilus sp.]|nr:S8 family serine peptidase [Nitrosopumilus sp.]